MYALEEAGIVAPDSGPSRASDAAAAAAGGGAAGINPLEISWLNSRKDTVGKDKEAELWAAAREFVTNVLAHAEQRSSNNCESGYKVGHDEKMEID